MKIYLIDWIDSAAEPGWVASFNLKSVKIAKCQSAGFLVKENKKFITLALNRAADGSHFPYGELMSIPKACITKKRKLR